MANVRLIHPIRHNGENKQPDDVIPGLTDAEAARLVRLGVGFIDEDSLPDMEDDPGVEDEHEAALTEVEPEQLESPDNAPPAEPVAKLAAAAPSPGRGKKKA